MKRYSLLVIVAAVGLLAAICADLESASTGKVKGQIINLKTKAPIGFAIVEITGTTMGAQADGNGNFLIVNVPPGVYTLRASVTGYTPVLIQNVKVVSDSTAVVNFTFEESLIETEAQIVLAAPGATQMVETKNMRQEDFGKIQMRGSRVAIGGCYPPSSPPPAHGGNRPPNGEPFDAMFFKHYGVNPIIDTEDDHFSTFAIDVDNASYAMARSYITSGNLPPQDAVRVEEFVNNFKYDYACPRNKAFTVHLEGAPSRFGEKYHLLRIGIAGQKIADTQRRDARLVFVVDVSGSMNREDRLGTVRRALRMLVDQLTPRDQVGIVIYGSTARVLLDPTSIRDKERIINAIESLIPDGATNAEAGLRLAYQMADRNFQHGAINRLILCSDGVANVGQTSVDEFMTFIKGYADRGITLTAVGFGMGNYNDVLMEQLGNKGNGHYAYVDSWTEAQRVFMENLTGTLQVIARDVKIQVDFDPAVVERYRLLGYENRDVADEDFRNDAVDGGEIGSGHMTTALYEIKLRPEASGDIGTIFIRYKHPETGAVREVSETLTRELVRGRFSQTSSDFRLAAAAAEFSEILRGSYWAKKSRLSDVLEVVRGVEMEKSNEQVTELMHLIAQADKMLKSKETPEPGTEPLGWEE